MATPNEPGELLWQAPIPKPASKGFLTASAAAVIALGLIFIWAGVTTGWYSGDLIILAVALAGGGVLLGMGYMMIRSAYFDIKMLEMQLCRFGVNLTTNRERRFIRFAELEHIRYIPEDLVRQGTDKKLAVGKLAVSILAANPYSVGHAIGTMLKKPIAGCLIVKAKDMPESGAAVPVDVAERLAPLLQKITVRA
jgi:hypothetical protein